MRRGEACSLTKFNLMRQSLKITVAKARPKRPRGSLRLYKVQSHETILLNYRGKARPRRPMGRGEAYSFTKFNLMRQSH
jgi:hypothetical protein